MLQPLGPAAGPRVPPAAQGGTARSPAVAVTGHRLGPSARAVPDPPAQEAHCPGCIDCTILPLPGGCRGQGLGFCPHEELSAGLGRPPRAARVRLPHQDTPLHLSCPLPPGPSSGANTSPLSHYSLETRGQAPPSHPATLEGHLEPCLEHRVCPDPSVLENIENIETHSPDAHQRGSRTKSRKGN